MVQLVFVHGVNNRKSADVLFPGSGLTYEQSEVSREQFFRDQTFPGQQITFYNPYWGQFGANPEGRFACIPKFTPPPTPHPMAAAAQIASALAGPQTVLLDRARINLAAAVQTLSVQSTLQHPDPATSESQRQRDFWGKAAAFAVDHPHPDWLSSVTTDDQFLAKLNETLSPAAPVGVRELTLPSFDLLGWLKSLGSDAAKKAINDSSKPITDFVRQDLSAHIGIFEGDIFRYLRSGAPRDRIRQIIHAALVAAFQARDPAGESLVVVSHSMGGPIVYDMLTDPAEMAKLNAEAPGFAIDLWVSVGSQVGIFEETKSYVADVNDPPTYPLKRPVCIRNWLNYYNNIDILSFMAAPIWQADVTDVMVDTFSGVTEAHGAYFTGAVFYEDLRRRAKAIGIQ